MNRFSGPSSASSSSSSGPSSSGPSTSGPSTSTPYMRPTMQPGPSNSSNLSTFRRNYQATQQARLSNQLQRTTKTPPIPGINQDIVTIVKRPLHMDPDPKCTELVTRLFLSQGIPMSAITDPTFIELIQHLNPGLKLPEESSMAKGLEKHCKHVKPVVNFTKCMGPMSVTVDVGGNADEKFLAFTIHYFEEIYERKSIVYLKKLLLSQIDPESILISIRRAVNSYSYSNVKFSSLVCPDEELLQLVQSSDVIRRYYVCFSYYMDNFVKEILKNEELACGLVQLRSFVRFVKSNGRVYGKYRRFQLSKGRPLDVPDVDDETWYSTAAFLTRCLVLHDDFNAFCDQFEYSPPITNETFLQLLYFQRLFEECLKLTKELSQPQNSISQVIPAISSLRTFITSGDGNPFQNMVYTAFIRCFQTIQRNNKYELAALLDPRYAYRPEILPMDKWNTLEMKACEEFVMLDGSLYKWFYKDLSMMDGHERYEAIRREFEIYRQKLQKERPDSTDSPHLFWGSCHESIMDWLPILAQDHISSPATVIDAGRFFNKGKGKFDRIINTYSRPTLDDCLTIAGPYQQFKGKGFPAEKNRVTAEQIKQLADTANRIQRQGMMVNMPIGEQKPDLIFPQEAKVETKVVPVKKGRGILRR